MLFQYLLQTERNAVDNSSYKKKIMSCEDRTRSRFSYSDNTTLLQTMRIHRISVTFRPSRGATMSMELAPAALQPYLLPRLVLLLKMVHILDNSNDILLLPLTQSKVTAIDVL